MVFCVASYISVLCSCIVTAFTFTNCWMAVRCKLLLLVVSVMLALHSSDSLYIFTLVTGLERYPNCAYNCTIDEVIVIELKIFGYDE